jgi:tetraacyldisaccharide 4'-kinase
MDAWLQRVWYGKSLWRWVLAPLSLLFACIVFVRRIFYRVGLFKSFKLAMPVIVVGNITVGGTGKTPFVIWLARLLREQGLVPAIVTRGYGGDSRAPVVVKPDSDPQLVGDEAVLLSIATHAIVVASRDRVAAAQAAITAGANVIIADDGLQHYRLQRDVEIAIVDSQRMLGNGWYLPAGPLRELKSRLSKVDVVLMHQRTGSEPLSPLASPLVSGVPQLQMNSELGDATCLSAKESRTLSSFAGQKVHALAGIGNPEAFFAALRGAGLNVNAKALADHARITKEDLTFADQAPILMTEKDAVKCRSFADARCWSVALKVSISDSDRQVLLAALQAKIGIK